MQFVDGDPVTGEADAGTGLEDALIDVGFDLEISDFRNQALRHSQGMRGQSPVEGRDGREKRRGSYGRRRLILRRQRRVTGIRHELRKPHHEVRCQLHVSGPTAEIAATSFA